MSLKNSTVIAFVHLLTSKINISVCLDRWFEEADNVIGGLTYGNIIRGIYCEVHPFTDLDKAKKSPNAVIASADEDEYDFLQFGDQNPTRVTMPTCPEMGTHKPIDSIMSSIFRKARVAKTSSQEKRILFVAADDQTLCTLFETAKLFDIRFPNGSAFLSLQTPRNVSMRSPQKYTGVDLMNFITKNIDKEGSLVGAFDKLLRENGSSLKDMLNDERNLKGTSRLKKFAPESIFNFRELELEDHEKFALFVHGVPTIATLKKIAEFTEKQWKDLTGRMTVREAILLDYWTQLQKTIKVVKFYDQVRKDSDNIVRCSDVKGLGEKMIQKLSTKVGHPLRHIDMMSIMEKAGSFDKFKAEIRTLKAPITDHWIKMIWNHYVQTPVVDIN